MPAQRKVVVCGVDGVIANLDGGVNRKWLAQNNTTIPLPFPTRRYDMVDCGFTDLQRNFYFNLLLYPRFYLTLEPLKYAHPTLTWLADFFDIVYLTARGSQTVDSTRAMKAATIDWLKSWDFPSGEVIVARASRKVDACIHLVGVECIAFVVEDHPETSLSMSECGFRTFLIDYPYNRLMETGGNLTRVDNLSQVVDYLPDMGYNIGPKAPSAVPAN